MKTILVTGGAGFIGSSYVAQRIKAGDKVIVLDILTYAGNLDNLTWIEGFSIEENFVKGDIANQELVTQLFSQYNFDYVVNFAAESHVDNSISNPDPFIFTNIVGTYNLLCCAKEYFLNLSTEKQNQFRFLHVSTDEVFGELGETGKFSEETPYAPSSPYSSSKAASDHLVKAWGITYNLPVIITNCSNNYGPRQFPEKLIPATVKRALNGEALTIYGDGKNIRDWIYVDDHNIGVQLALEKGKLGETYCLGTNNEKTNNEIVHLICEILDRIKPQENSYKNLITYVKDRAGHDLRYAIDASKAQNELGFAPQTDFEQALEATIKSYI